MLPKKQTAGCLSLQISRKVFLSLLALPPGELSAKPTERACKFPSPASLRSATSPRGRGKVSDRRGRLSLRVSRGVSPGIYSRRVSPGARTKRSAPRQAKISRSVGLYTRSFQTSQARQAVT